MWFKIITVCLLVCFFHQTDCCQETPVVSTPSGQVKGSILISRLGKKIYAFRGIRYIQPPVGELRFKPPVPIDSWSGVYDATNDGYLCPQPLRTDFNIGNISEDCITVNVYSTKIAGNPKRPVIVHLNPGGFFSEGAVSYWNGPQYIMDQDVVYVTFAYRIGALGFISTGDKFAPGNNGLKDQVVLLNWVKKNIASFGGDPDNITLQGYSAGAWCIVFLMLSPMTRGLGLFHKAIIMSGGGPLQSEYLPKNQFPLAQKLARFLDCPDDTSERIMNCLQKADALDMAQSFYPFREFGDQYSVFSPVVDGEFLTENTTKLTKESNFESIPIMVGQTTDETGYSAFTVINNETLLEEINNNFTRVAPIAFIYERDTPKSVRVSKALKQFYFNDKRIDKSQLDNLAKAYSDSIVGFAVHRATIDLAQYNTKPVYSYCFSFQGRYSYFYLPGTNKTWGVVHSDDLIYLVYSSGYEKEFYPLFGKDSPQPEVSMVEKLTRLHYNFAKTGNPTPERIPLFNNIKWEPFTLQNKEYLDIGKKLVMKKKLYEDRFAFWDKQFPV